jgi:hypothetical protein
MDGMIFDESFLNGGRFNGTENDKAELGLAEMGKGNYGEAESHFNEALRADPEDVHALLGLGVLYQHTGRKTKAREMYEAILAIRPEQTEQSVVWNNFSVRPVSEIASVNLALLDSGAGPARGQGPLVISGAPAMAVAPARPAMLAPQTGLKDVTDPEAAAPVMFAQADANIAARFKTLKVLDEQGLVTADEFAQRRRVNIGALLPLTSAPPAAGLDRPVPSTQQIAGRLRAIGRALEMRALSVAQHASERTMILDALMPARPMVQVKPAIPPDGLMAAADAVRRLEQLRDLGLITSDEYARERAAVELAMQPAPPGDGTAGSNPGSIAPAAGGRDGVHLASYRSRQAADRGWVQLRRAHKGLLGGLGSEINEVDLGPGRGLFYRLKAGPLADRARAVEICRKLKSQNQYCEPTLLGAG